MPCYNSLLVNGSTYWCFLHYYQQAAWRIIEYLRGSEQELLQIYTADLVEILNPVSWKLMSFPVSIILHHVDGLKNRLHNTFAHPEVHVSVIQ